MPPKTKKAKGEKGAKKKTMSLDDVDTNLLTRPKLEEFCINVYEALTKEKQDSDFLRLERDKLVNMLDIAREQLILAKHENYKKQMELDDVEENHRLQLNQKKEQLLHLKCERNSDYLNSTLESVKTRTSEQISHEKRLKEIQTDINELKFQFIDLETDFSDTKTMQEIDSAEEKSKLNQEEKELSILTEQKWDRKINSKVSFLSDIFQQEYNQLENRKIKESLQLIKSNDRFTFDLKHYYRKIVYHNLNVTMRLKENLQELKNETAAVDKNLSLLRIKNKELKESISGSNKEIQSLQEQLTHSAEDQKELKKTRKELERKNATLEHLKLELDTLNMAVCKHDEIIDSLTQEKDNRLIMLKVMVEEIIVVLEYLAVHLRHKLDELDSMLDNLRGNSAQSLHPAKDHLTWELGTVVNQHGQILENFRHLLAKYDVHMDNTGFTPLLAQEILKRADFLRILVSED